MNICSGKTKGVAEKKFVERIRHVTHEYTHLSQKRQKLIQHYPGKNCGGASCLMTWIL